MSISCALLVLLSTAWSRQAIAQETQPALVVEKLYYLVVTLHPLGVPDGPAKTAIWPLLSKRLIKAFETRSACDDDWLRQHPNANVPPYILKPPGFSEVGLFSGGDELGYISGAKVKSFVEQADGSYLVRVQIWSYFDGGLPELRTKKIYRWQVGVRVISENGRNVVDDIFFFKNVFNDKSVYVSRMIKSGCNGSHAVPDSNQAP
jgi:hypothetical protein